MQDDIASKWFPLSEPQKSRWFRYAMEAGNIGLHNNGVAARLDGPVDHKAFSRALQQLVDRHPMLRARFGERDGIPQQSIMPTAVAQVTLVDARADTQAALHERITADLFRPFDLNCPPLLRVHLYQCGPDQTVMLFVFDHMVIDGWSFWRLLDELGQVLGAHVRGEASLVATERPGAGYADFVAWQRDWLAGPLA